MFFMGSRTRKGATSLRRQPLCSSSPRDEGYSVIASLAHPHSTFLFCLFSEGDLYRIPVREQDERHIPQRPVAVKFCATCFQRGRSCLNQPVSDGALRA